MGDSYIGAEHALLAMLRARETVPARALADLADLDVLEAAVLEAKDAVVGRPPADAVFLPEVQVMDGPLRNAVADALPDGTTFVFNRDAGGRTWMRVPGRGDGSDRELTSEVLNAALASLNRPMLSS
jgi:hypothetical protein